MNGAATIPPHGARSLPPGPTPRPATSPARPRFSSRAFPLLVALAGLLLTARAAPPTLEHVHPAGAGPGASVTVALTGKADPWPAQAWIQGPGVSVTAETNQNRLRIEVGTNAPPGPRLLRLFNPEGASEPRFFVVGEQAEIPEAEPNSQVSAAQPVPSLPATVNGRLDRNGDVDAFSFPLRAGDWLEARLDAYTLMSKLDAVLRLVDSGNRVLAWNHDDATLDPRLVWRCDADRTVILQVFGFRHPADASIQLAGGESAVYRLHLASRTHPPLFAPDSGDAALVEPDPAAAAAAAAPFSLPVSILGTLSQGREIDRFRFTAPTGCVVVAEVEAARLGSPLDAWLRLETAEGKELAANDDADGSRDPRLEWTSPGGDAPIVAVVGSLTHQGGPEHRYRLRLRCGTPEVRATVEASRYTVAPGSSLDVKLQVQRLHGHQQPLVAAFEGLPEGVRGERVTVNATNREPVLRLEASPGTAPFNGPIRILLSDPASPEPTPAAFELVSRGENNGVPQGYSRLVLDRTDLLWLTVRPSTNAAASP